jgi:peptide/nickel transport system permease protein
MLIYLLKRLLYALPIALGVSLVSFTLVYLAPGDPLNAIAPADAPVEVIEALKVSYGLDKPLPLRYALWLGRALQGDLGASIATGRSVAREVMSAVSNTLVLAGVAAAVGVGLGCVLGGLAGYRVGSWVDRLASFLSVIGVSVPHYWLGLVLTIVFSVTLGWLPAMGAGPGGSGEWAWDIEHLRHLVLPAATLCVIPMGIVTRTVRALVAEAGLQVGYLMGGSILVETVFAWPGTGFLLNTAIFQRDIPLLQGIILVLCLFFVALNLLVDIAQPLVDPRMGRA